MVLWALGGVLALSSAGMLLALAGANHQRRRFRLACSLSGLMPDDSTRASAGGAFPVTVSLRASAGRGQSTEIEMTGLPDTVVLFTESGAHRPGLSFVPDIEVGDPAFDACFRVAGDERIALAALDAETRDRALDLVVALDLCIADGVLRASVSRPILDDGVMRELVDSLRALADAMAQGAGDTHARLLENTFSDPVSGVRLRNLDVLRATSTPALADDARRRALDAPYPALRVRAAGAAGSAGRPALLAMVSNRRARAGLRREALAQLARSASAAVLTPVVRYALQDRHPDLVELAANAARERTLTGVLDALRSRALSCKTVKTPRARRMAVALAEALGALGPVGDLETEGALVALVAVPDLQVQLAAIEALGWAGTVSVVPMLQALDGARQVIHARKVAIRSIQSRAVWAEAGGLCLVDAGEGEGHLSLSVTPGAISL